MQIIKSILISGLLSVLFIGQTLSNPLVQQEGLTSFNIESSGWEPIPFRSMIGDLELDVFYLMPGVPSPLHGVLVDKDDFNKLEFISNRQIEWCDERLDKERKLCDSRVADCFETCKDSNKEYIQRIGQLEDNMEKLTLDKKSIADEILYWKIGSVSDGVLIVSITLYAQLK